MESWQKKLKDRILYLSDQNFKLSMEIESLRRENVMLHKLVSGPPTVLIACEKIVEAATQLTCNAQQMMKEAKR